MLCKCGSDKKYEACCELAHLNHSSVASAEALMRSRYCAFELHKADYIFETTLPSARKGLRIADILSWAVGNKWMGLEILSVEPNNVEFKAHYLDEQLVPQIHHEYSYFKQKDGKWYFEKGSYPS